MKIVIHSKNYYVTHEASGTCRKTLAPAFTLEPIIIPNPNPHLEHSPHLYTKALHFTL